MRHVPGEEVYSVGSFYEARRLLQALMNPKKETSISTADITDEMLLELRKREKELSHNEKFWLESLTNLQKNRTEPPEYVISQETKDELHRIAQALEQSAESYDQPLPRVLDVKYLFGFLDTESVTLSRPAKELAEKMLEFFDILQKECVADIVVAQEGELQDYYYREHNSYIDTLRSLLRERPQFYALIGQTLDDLSHYNGFSSVRSQIEKYILYKLRSSGFADTTIEDLKAQNNNLWDQIDKKAA